LLVLVAAGVGLWFRGSGDTATSPPTGTPAAPARPVRPGLLSVNSTPWGIVFVDDLRVGPTPVLEFELPPGQHRLRIERPGFAPYEQILEMASGDRIRLSDIVLKPER
jgi:hypothetical protein